MKEYIDMTQNEIFEIVKRGGNNLTRLNDEVANYLDTLELSDLARHYINTTPISDMTDAWGGYFKAEEIEEEVKRMEEME